MWVACIRWKIHSFLESLKTKVKKRRRKRNACLSLLHSEPFLTIPGFESHQRNSRSSHRHERSWSPCTRMQTANGHEECPYGACFGRVKRQSKRYYIIYLCLGKFSVFGDHPMKKEPSSYLKQVLYGELSTGKSLLRLPCYIHTKQHLHNHEFQISDFCFKLCSEKSAGKKWKTGFYLSNSKLPNTVQDLQESWSFDELCEQSLNPD